jgi:CheY-like chemotaxis protein
MTNKNVRVFVVDDEPVITWTLAAILQSKGFHAQAFTNPLEALASAQVEAPDLLVSDVVMPQLSGIDLAIRIKAACPRCKILLFSGQASTVDFLTGAREMDTSIQVLTKPVHPLDLLAAIREQGIVVGAASA